MGITISWLKFIHSMMLFTVFIALIAVAFATLWGLRPVSYEQYLQAKEQTNSQTGNVAGEFTNVEELDFLPNSNEQVQKILFVRPLANPVFFDFDLSAGIESAKFNLRANKGILQVESGEKLSVFNLDNRQPTPLTYEINLSGYSASLSADLVELNYQPESNSYIFTLSPGESAEIMLTIDENRLKDIEMIISVLQNEQFEQNTDINHDSTDLGTLIVG